MVGNSTYVFGYAVTLRNDREIVDGIHNTRKAAERSYELNTGIDLVEYHDQHEIVRIDATVKLIDEQWPRI